jgi:riboflavin kinase/FMN adenylyltransferase
MASYLVDWDKEIPAACRGGAVAIGNFDGAHRGHAELVAELARVARDVGGPAVALTFDPHPRAILRPDTPIALLSTPADRDAHLHQLGADHVLTLRATPALFELRAARFFDLVVRGGLAARAMVEGTNFHFGHGREGDVALLTRLCREAGLGLSVVPPVVIDGAEVSSSRIRADLEAGDVARAARLLGRPYLLRGVVGSGQRRGRTIGVPTANLERVATVVPAEGVYAARVWVLSGRAWPGAVNVGPNPTFAEQAAKIEAHLIGFDGDLYGQEVGVEFLERLRATRRFSSADELVAQLRRDIDQARAIAEQPGREP